MISGIHHLTAVCSDARRTVDFYSRILGLRLVKKTVNFDDPGVYHLYFGNSTGTPGSLVTFFEWSTLPKGQRGVGATHHLAFITESNDAQLRWKRWLTDNGYEVTGPYDRKYFRSIYFEDPDGLILEIATRLPGWTIDEQPGELGRKIIQPDFHLTKAGRNEEEISRTTWNEPVDSITDEMRLSGIHHITAIASDLQRTAEFFTGMLGLQLLKRTFNYDNPTSAHYYFGVERGEAGTIITYFDAPRDGATRGRIGTGMTHHFALAVSDEDEQRKWQSKLLDAGLRVTHIMDRIYFKSIYFQDPDGHILEIATAGPGFLIDEPEESLGSHLKLPPWLEADRGRIEETLQPIAIGNYNNKARSARN